LLSHRRATGLERREGGERGSPESEDLPPAAPVPLEEGGNVLRRFALVTATAGLLAALLLPASALGMRVHVRVEGATRTIFGATAPLVRAFTGTLDTGDGVTLTLPRATALGALEAASRRGEFYYRLTQTSFGPYVSQIGRRPGAGSRGWVFKVNGVSPPVGADSYRLEPGDEVLWYYATFGPTGGPLTLDLVRAGKGCFRAIEVDDLGGRARARGVVFKLDGRPVASASGLICPDGHWHHLRATRSGAVRSQVLGPR
jgi:hypothetical protein